MTESAPAETEDLTGKSRILSNVLTSWIAQLLTIITGFLLPRMIDESVGQAGLGIWDFAWTISSYIALSQLGIGSSLNRYIAKFRSLNDSKALSESISTTIVIQFCIAAVVAMVCIALYFIIPRVFTDELGESMEMGRWVVVLLGMSVAVQLLFDTSRGILTGCHRWDLFNAINSLTHFIGTGVMIVALLMGYGLVVVAWIYLGMMLVQGVCRAIAASRVCPEAKFSFQNATWPFAATITSFGIKSIAVGLPSIIVQQSINVAVVSSLGPAALAVLARPLALIRFIETFMTRFTFILTPMAESVSLLEGQDKLLDFLRQSATYSLAMAMPPITLLVLFGDEIIALWMGADYVNSIILQIFCLTALLTACHGAIFRIVIGLDLHGRAVVPILTLTVVLLAVALGASTFVDQLGLAYFAAASGTIFVLLNGVFLPLYSCRKLNLGVLSYLSCFVHRAIIIVAIASCTLLIIDTYAPLSLFYMIILAAMYGGFMLIVYFFSLAPAEFRQKVLALRLFQPSE